jgi:hypothetical protein
MIQKKLYVLALVGALYSPNVMADEQPKYNTGILSEDTPVLASRGTKEAFGTSKGIINLLGPKLLDSKSLDDAFQDNDNITVEEIRK